MAILEMASAFGKKPQNSYLEAMVLEKNERVARASLRDLLAFHDSLEDEIRNVLAVKDKTVVHRELLIKLMVVKEKYQTAMHGLRVYDDNQACYALISFADAVQDLMAHMHSQRKH